MALLKGKVAAKHSGITALKNIVIEYMEKEMLKKRNVYQKSGNNNTGRKSG